MIKKRSDCFSSEEQKYLNIKKINFSEYDESSDL